MFVFKAAVVGAGTMGGEIAQAIAASDIPVVLKDIDQKFVDHGLEKAREVTKGQLDRLVKKEKLTQEQADARLEEVMGLIEGTTSYDSFGDVDFVIEAAPEKMEIKRQVYAELDAVTPGHAILASNTSSLSITEMGDATLRPGQGRRLPLLLPGVGDAAGRDHRGRGHRPRGDPGRVQLRPDDPQAADHLRRGPRLRRQPDPQLGGRRDLARAGGEGALDQEDRRGRRRRQRRADGPVLPRRPARPRHVFHVAEHLRESYGDSFYVHEGMRKLVADGKLGAKTGGSGFYENGEPQIPGDAEPDGEALAELMKLKAVVESCLVLQEGVCTVREIDLGMMAGAGMDPRRGIFPPFMGADMLGLDVVLEKLEAAEAEHGERFAPPTVLRRLVAQGRLGTKTGQGFYAYPQPDEGDQTDTIKLETRGDVAIAWLANPPMNAISPQVIKDLGTVWERVKESGEIRALVIASSIPVVFSAGADIKAFTQMDEAGGEDLIDSGHALLRDMGLSQVSTIAAVNALAFGGGCELAMACNFRIAAESAVFGQPEIKLGIIPGFGGTQRLPRLVGDEKALEMNLIGDAMLAGEAEAYGLANRVVPDHELFDAAVSWARGSPARRRSPSSRSSSPPTTPTSTQGIEQEKEGFRTAFTSEDAREGIGAFLGKRAPKWEGK